MVQRQWCDRLLLCALLYMVMSKCAVCVLMWLVKQETTWRPSEVRAPPSAY